MGFDAEEDIEVYPNSFCCDYKKMTEFFFFLVDIVSFFEAVHVPETKS